MTPAPPRRTIAAAREADMGNTQGRSKPKLRSLKGKQASTGEDRLALYESGLMAMGKAKSGIIAFECLERPERFVQIEHMPGSRRLYFEIGSEALSEAGRDMLVSMRFRPPNVSTPTYNQLAPPATDLARHVEKVFVEALECGRSYTVKVVEASDALPSPIIRWVTTPYRYYWVDWDAAWWKKVGLLLFTLIGIAIEVVIVAYTAGVW